MTDTPQGPRGLVVLQTVAAVGIVIWWVYWFASGSNTSHPRCDLAYENSFPLADLVLAAVLGVAAYGFAKGRPVAVQAGWLAAGMAFSLATLDTTHNLLTGGFEGPPLKIAQKVLFAAVNGTVGVWTVLRLRGVPEVPFDGRGLAVVGGLFLPAAVVWELIGDGCDGALAFSGVGVGALLLALAMGLAFRRTVGWAWVLAGALLHAGLVLLLHLFL